MDHFPGERDPKDALSLFAEIETDPDKDRIHAEWTGTGTDLRRRDAIDLGYQAITFGIKDLQLSSDPLLYPIANIQGDNPIITANLSADGEEGFFGMSQPYRIVEAGGKKIGVTAVFGPGYQEQLAAGGEFEISDAAASVAKVVPELEGCDLKVLLVHGTPAEATELARQIH